MDNQPHGLSVFERERERERELEVQRRQHAIQQQEDLAQREREHNERERQERERLHRDQYQPTPPHPPPHQNNTGSITIHQPVASRLPGAIHSPGGLLANHGGAPPHPGPLGAPSGPGNAFGGPLQSDTGRVIQQNPQLATSQLQQQQQAFGPSILHHNTPNAPQAFGGPLQQQQQQQEAVRLQQLPFGASIAQVHQMPGAPALGQGGQQPILNVSVLI